MPANVNYGDILTTTIEHRSRELADNVTDNNALLMKLKERDKVRPVSGGHVILEELDIEENSSFKWYSGYEGLNVSPSATFSAAEFGIKECAVAVTMSGLEAAQNMGREAFIDLLKARVKNAERTMKNKMSEAIYSDGTGDGGKQIGGLQLLIASNPVIGTVGNINRASVLAWRNQVVGGVTDENILQKMNELYLKTKRGMDTTDLIVADDAMYTRYEGRLQQDMRFALSDNKMGQVEHLMYKQAPVVADGGIDGRAPTESMYFLNCNYLSYRPMKGYDMTSSEKRFALDQDAHVQYIFWKGNLTLSNAMLQGRLSA